MAGNAVGNCAESPTRSVLGDVLSLRGLVVFALSVAFLTSWLLISWLLGSVVFYPGGAALCCAPIATLGFVRRLRRVPLLFVDSQLAVALAFLIFFSSGLVTLSSNGGLRYATIGDPDYGFVLVTLVKLAAIAGAVMLAPPAAPTMLISPTLAPPSAARLLWFAQVLVVVSVAGTALSVVQAGGLQAAAELFTTHEKDATDSLAGTAGQAIWQLFAVPACVAAGSAAVLKEIDTRFRGVCLVEFVLLLTIATFVYGSRLSLSLALIGLGGAYCFARARPASAVAAVLALVFTVAVSYPILQARSEAANNPASFEVARVVGYNVFDISMAVTELTDELSEKVADPERFWLAAESVPPLVGVGSEELSSTRLDVLVAQSVDGGNLERGRVTGFPPALPAALLVAYGLLLAVVIALGFGLACSLLGLLFPTSVESPVGASRVFWYGFLVSSIFNVFKDGDLALGTAVVAKTSLYLIAIYGILFVLTYRKETGKWVAR